MTELIRIGSTTLYRLASGEDYVFLRWAPGSESIISLDQTWSDNGPSPLCGYYVFLSAIPSRAEEAAELEAALRAVLPTPSITGFAWAMWQRRDRTADLYGIVTLAIDGTGRPAVTADAALRLPPGLLRFSFIRAMRAQATRNRDGVDGLLLTIESSKSEGPPFGLRIPLLGTLCGCVLFQGLLASRVQTSQSIKELAEVRIDPLRPFDAPRTRITQLGEHYVLREESPASYLLTPVTDYVAGRPM
ncbi:MAG: hypothetical protein ACRDRO_16645 [Pseudonocardiaceae bacterium]